MPPLIPVGAALFGWYKKHWLLTGVGVGYILAWVLIYQGFEQQAPQVGGFQLL